MQCVACKSELAEGATLCRACHTYQRPLRRYLQNSGLAVTLLSVFASAVLFIGTKGGELVGRWHPPDVEVLAFSSLGDKVFFNGGGAEVFLTEVRIVSRDLPDEMRWVVPIHEPIPPRGHLKVPGDQATALDYRWVYGYGLDPEQKLIYANQTKWQDCIEMDFVADGSARYRQVVEGVDAPMTPTYAGQAVLIRSGPSGEKAAGSFPVTGFVVWWQGPDCDQVVPSH